jgi:ubiquinone/menaquinone biosynthesis C-methylase UbiE
MNETRTTANSNIIRPAAAGRREIVDYNNEDFIGYWESASKQLLNKIEFKIVGELLPQRSGWFVDIGCGFGRLGPIYLGNGRKVIMTDYSIKQLEIAADRFKDKGVYFVAADAGNLPFRPHVFRSGICMRLVHHISDPETLLSECSRIFKSGAPVVINYINKRSLLRILKYGAGCFKKNHERTSPIIFSTHPSFFKRLVTRSGFGIKKIRGAGFVHQAVYACNKIDQLIENTPLVSTVMRLFEQTADATIGRTGFALMQYVAMEKTGRPQQSSVPDDRCENFKDILMCPHCGSFEFAESKEKLECTSCKKGFSKVGEIYDFRT